jgi:hypothetical protein
MAICKGEGGVSSMGLVTLNEMSESLSESYS